MRTTGQLKGHERRVGTEWVVLMQGQRFHLGLTLVDGGCDITYEGETYALRTDWKLGDILLPGHLERRADLHPGRADGPEIPRLPLGHAGRRHRHDRPAPPSCWPSCPTSRRRTSPSSCSRPCPACSTEIAVKAGQEVRAGENLVVIEAMKMQNILKAESDCVVAEVMAKPGDSLAVDQPIVRFQ